MTMTVLGIYNTALSAVHAKGRLSSLTENSREREECDIWYDLVVQTVQEAAHWPSSRSVAALTLVATRADNSDWTISDPAPQYKYKYRLPTEYLRAWHLTDYTRFELFYDSDLDTVLLHSNTPNAALVYSRLQTSVHLWSPNQQQATIHGLAAHIAGPLTGRGELVQKNVNLANDFLGKAQEAVTNEQFHQVKAIPMSIRARGYTGYEEQVTRYYYPYGSFFSAGVTTR